MIYYFGIRYIIGMVDWNGIVVYIYDFGVDF